MGRSGDNQLVQDEAAKPSRASYLSIRGLGKRYGAFAALQDVDLDVAEGEFVCFLGPSGCGKTTLLRIIAGLTSQSEGRICQAGLDISDLGVSERDFGIVFQSYALFPNLSVARNVGYGLEAEGRLDAAKRRARVDELLDLVGLAAARDRFPGQLSGGQQQRVALARALATSPGLLLLDEPLSALDARVRQRLRLEIKALQERIGVTTIMVTHDQEEALTIADRIVVMNEGRIEQIGTPEEIYCEPATAFVANFIGAMNLLDARVVGERELLIGDKRLACSAAFTGCSVDEEVVVCVRPEDIALGTDDRDAEGAHDVRIVALEFLGPFHRARVESRACRTLTLSVDLPSSVVRAKRLRVGSAMRVVLPGENLRIFPRGRSQQFRAGEGKGATI
ncbi:MAG: ABC transporter ATP-binding protein [Alphaproteobacteria bacterium 65-37]|nr:MAG: ABC transporter ATP-binding protein [Alphaproteobacteria bacterium 65-37]